jgi:quercetin dioxygenase-like cupin family protein
LLRSKVDYDAIPAVLARDVRASRRILPQISWIPKHEAVMQKRNLGSADLEVSALGCMALSNKSLFIGIAMCAAALFASAADPQVRSASSAANSAQQITRAGDQASTFGSVENFTGRARVDPLFSPNENINASLAYVTFDPGARSAWHMHPAGQRLVVTAGVGLTQELGKPVQVIRPGDVVWCPPGVKHWHGAAPNTAMTHLAMSGYVDGKSVIWMEKVTDEQYNAR